MSTLGPTFSSEGKFELRSHPWWAGGWACELSCVLRVTSHRSRTERGLMEGRGRVVEGVFCDCFMFALCLTVPIPWRGHFKHERRFFRIIPGKLVQDEIVPGAGVGRPISDLLPRILLTSKAEAPSALATSNHRPICYQVTHRKWTYANW